ncbi:hypothetical protein RRG08_019102 [Elysia crispata]|uniref:Uncharacterized protein n=1 Tax=Elysia crispata TaxID=231223 RepID=A0AAE1A5R3_9GAST|nr:hypothetical protein RRG08_019102 [Elysia crispata]
MSFDLRTINRDEFDSITAAGQQQVYSAIIASWTRSLVTLMPGLAAQLIQAAPPPAKVKDDCKREVKVAAKLTTC